MPTKTIKLTIQEMCLLNQELNSEKGLLSEKLPMVLKYHLTKIATVAAEEQSSLDKLRDETIKSLGTEKEDGSFMIPQFIDQKANPPLKAQKVINPVYLDFVKEMETLVNTEREVVYEEMTIEDFKDVSSEGNYITLFKLLN